LISPKCLFLGQNRTTDLFVQPIADRGSQL